MKDLEKYITVNVMTFFLKNTKYCCKTKLMKLLCFLDFELFKVSGTPATRLVYIADEYGPYPKKLGDLLYPDTMDYFLSEYFEITKEQSRNENDFYKITPKKEIDFDYFSRATLRIMERLAKEYYETKANELVEIAHAVGTPWDKTIKSAGYDAEIDYFSVFDEENDVTAIYRENIEDRKIILEALSG